MTSFWRYSRWRGSFWDAWRFNRWRRWPVWFRVVWPLELVTILTLGIGAAAGWRW